MSTPPLSPQDVSGLIDKLLKSKDPATVGLRRILKRKCEEREAFPLKDMSFEQFSGSEDCGTGTFDAEEVQVLQQEKQLNELRQQLTVEQENAKKAAEEAYQKGLAEGKAQGIKEGGDEAKKNYDKQLNAIEERVAAIFSDVKTAKTEQLMQAQRTLIELSMAMARKIVITELAANPDIVLATIKKALTFIAERERLIVRVSPNDLETVSGKKEFWTSISERLEGIKIEGDERIGKGGCIIESNSGVADARMETMFDEMRDIIEKTWDSISSGSENEAQDDVYTISNDTETPADNNKPDSSEAQPPEAPADTPPAHDQTANESNDTAS